MIALDTLKALAKRLWRGVHWEKTPQGPRCIREPLKLLHVQRHLVEQGFAVGLAPITPGTSTTQVALLDIDDHSGTAGWDKVLSAALQIAKAYPTALSPHLFRSSGGKGIHIIYMWATPQDAYSVRLMLKAMLANMSYKPGTKGLQHNEIEIFPKQDSVPADGVGSMFILPFSRESVPISSTGELLDIDYFTGWRDSDPVPVLTKPERIATSNTTPAELATLERALDAIPNTADNRLPYDDWRNVIFAIHYATQGSDAGLALAHKFSAKYAGNNPEFLDSQVWPHIKDTRDSPITPATIYALARPYGFDDTIDYLDSLPDILGTNPDNAHQNGHVAENATIVATNRFPIFPPEVFASRPFPTWLVRNILPRAELIVLYGESTAGKTFIALDLAASIALGTKWRDEFPSIKAPVIYVCAEGSGGFAMRIKAYMQAFNLTTFDLGTLPSSPNFLAVDDVKDVIRSIQAFIPNPALVVVDTLAQVISGGDENTGEDMGKLITHCKQITKHTGATVLLVHHSGKDVTKGARGWSGLKGAADAELEVSHDEALPYRVVKVTKQKDGPGEGSTYPFKLKPVSIGFNDDNEPIDSCVIEHIAKSEAQDMRPNRQPLGAWQRAIFAAATDLQPIDNSGVPLSDVLAKAARSLDKKETYQTREAGTRALLSLEDRGMLVKDADGKVYIPQGVEGLNSCGGLV